MQLTPNASSLVADIVRTIINHVLPESSTVLIDTDQIADKVSHAIAEVIQLEIGKLGIVLATHDLVSGVERVLDLWRDQNADGLVARSLAGIVEEIGPNEPLPDPPAGFTRFTGDVDGV